MRGVAVVREAEDRGRRGGGGGGGGAMGGSWYASMRNARLTARNACLTVSRYSRNLFHMRSCCSCVSTDLRAPAVSSKTFPIDIPNDPRSPSVGGCGDTPNSSPSESDIGFLKRYRSK